VLELLEQSQNVVPTPLLAAAALAIGILMLVKGGSWLVDGSVGLARRVGVARLIIGLTVVAFGTSAPELALNIMAVLKDNGELSFGNVVGSNIANIGLVLGIAALTKPFVVHSRILAKELPWLIFISVVMVAIALIPQQGLTLDRQGVGFGYTWPQGLALLALFVLAVRLWFVTAEHEVADPLTKEAAEATEGEPTMSMRASIFWFVFGLAVLLLGGNFAAEGAESFAAWAGLSQALIGLTVVAIGTSLPEVTTVIIACRQGHPDIAVGNVIGSNLFNILLVLGVTSTIGPVPVPMWGFWDLGAMFVLTLLLVPLMRTHANTLVRREGLLLVVLYIGYITWTVLREKM